MDKIETINSRTAGIVRDKVQKALDSALEGLGLKANFQGRITYGSGYLRGQLEVSVVDEALGQPITRESKEFERRSLHNPDWPSVFSQIGAAFNGSPRYLVLGYMTRCHKYPILCQDRVKGTQIKMTVKQMLVYADIDTVKPTGPVPTPPKPKPETDSDSDPVVDTRPSNSLPSPEDSLAMDL